MSILIVLQTLIFSVGGPNHFKNHNLLLFGSSVYKKVAGTATSCIQEIILILSVHFRKLSVFQLDYYACKFLYNASYYSD